MKKVMIYLWVIINCVLGFALGWLIAFGFLNLNNQLVVVFIGIISAVLHGYLWIRILLGGKRQQKSIFLVIQLVIVTMIAGLYFSQRLTFQNTPIIGKNFEKSFTKLWKAMDEVYPYFELKGVDWNQTYEKYHPLALDVTNDQEYFLIIAHMLGELKDAHTDVITPNLNNKALCIGNKSGRFGHR